MITLQTSIKVQKLINNRKCCVNFISWKYKIIYQLHNLPKKESKKEMILTNSTYIVMQYIFIQIKNFSMLLYFSVVL